METFQEALTKLIDNDVYSYAKVAATVGLVIAVRLYLRKAVSAVMGGSNLQRKRSLSFNSKVMLGSFPESAGVWPPIINVLFIVENCGSKKELMKLFEPMICYERMRCVIRDNELVPVKVKMEDHITTVTVPNTGELKKYVDKVCETDLDDISSKPPWMIHAITNKGGEDTILWRLHHVIGDGIAIIGATSKFVNTVDGQPLDFSAKASSMKGGREEGSRDSILEKVGCFFRVLATPASAYDATVAFNPMDKKMPVMSGRRTAVYLPTISLDWVKAIKNAAGVTVNDVMLSAIGGVIRRFSLTRGESAAYLAKAVNRALLPVALPRPAVELTSNLTGLRNKWAFASVDLPISGATSAERLRSCHESTMALKGSSMVALQWLVQTYLLPLMPAFLRKQTALDLFARHSMVFSNLPGNEEPLLLGTRPLLGLQVIFPNLLPQSILISYNKRIFSNLVVDPAYISDADKKLLQSLWREELEEMADSLHVTKEAIFAEEQYLL
jgi:hypothetical protein